MTRSLRIALLGSALSLMLAPAALADCQQLFFPVAVGGRAADAILTAYR
ncbi:MAG: hypothetical protein ACYC10_19370 [Allorhizobium sp.]